ncbi:MAG: GtrA family protein [Cellvibrio sp.]|uniref:GtrA family protein n=1 Tax=Cellvibrio sp. TaxID=1965322 RepID=UPI0027229965|nr:GtrA family protein [Cellvibrio sp.]
MKELFRFVIVGVLNTIVGYSLYALFLYGGLSYSYALLFATILGVLFNFKTLGRLVFNSHDNRLIVKFFAVYTLTFCLNLGLIRIFTEMGLSAYIGGAIALIPTTIASFILNKYFVFKG